MRMACTRRIWIKLPARRHATRLHAQKRGAFGAPFFVQALRTEPLAGHLKRVLGSELHALHITIITGFGFPLGVDQLTTQ